jgi:hypothetical protein
VKTFAGRWTALVVLMSAVLGTLWVRAQTQVVMPQPAQLRFQALLMEPIATPEGRSVVAGSSALLIKDRVSGRCFLAVTLGNSLGLSPAECAQ